MYREGRAMRGTKPTLRTDAPGALTTAPRAPAWLSADAKREWLRVIGDLVSRRIVTAADLGGVENYCVAVGRVRQLEKLIEAEFDLRLLRAQNQALETSRRLAAELGLTPVSRSRPSVRDAANDDNDLDSFNL